MHRFETSIFYDETDLSGAVYHSNYLKYFSRGRELLLGFEKMQQLCNQGIFFVVHRIETRFRRPAHFGEQLVIETECTHNRPPRLRFAQRALRKDVLLVEAQVEVAVVNSQGKPVRLALFEQTA